MAVIAAAVCDLIKHIAPHHRTEIVAIGDLANAFQMGEQYIAGILIAVGIHISSSAEPFRLVHTYMDFIGAETFSER